MMKKLLAYILALVMVFGLTACSGAETASNNNSDPAASDAGESPASGGGSKVVLGTSADYPPFEYHILENGEDKIVGFEVSLAYRIAEDMGVELEIVDMSFDNLLTLLAKGDCDFVIAAMETSDERLNAASCSDPYYTDLPAMILVKADALDTFQSFEDFAGKSVGAQSGTTKAEIIPEFMPDATPLLMGSVTDLVNNLIYDKCDALILDGAVAMQYAANDETLAIVHTVALGDALPYCVWVAKDDPSGLLPGINSTIAQALADGSMDQYIADADVLSSQALD